MNLEGSRDYSSDEEEGEDARGSWGPMGSASWREARPADAQTPPSFCRRCDPCRGRGRLEGIPGVSLVARSSAGSSLASLRDGGGGGNEIGFMGIVGSPSPNLERARLLTYPEWRSAKAMHRGFWMIGGSVETSFIASRDHRTAL